MISLMNQLIYPCFDNCVTPWGETKVPAPLNSESLMEHGNLHRISFGFDNIF